MYPLHNYPDDHIKTITNASLKKCSDDCNSDNNCKGFIYDRTNKVCWTNRDFKRNSRKIENGHDTFIKVSEDKFSGGKIEPKEEYQTLKFIDWWGASANNIGEADGDDCFRLCTDNDNCVTIVQNKNGHCWLKSELALNDKSNTLYGLNDDFITYNKLTQDLNNAKEKLRKTRRWSNCNLTADSERYRTENCKKALGDKWIQSGENSEASEDNNVLRRGRCNPLDTHNQCRRSEDLINEDFVNYIDLLYRSTTTLKNYEVLPKVAVGGDIISSSTDNTSLDHCMNKCNENIICSSAVYNPSTRECILKEDTLNRNDTINSNVISLVNLVKAPKTRSSTII
jgi:hypothetical protein